MTKKNTEPQPGSKKALRAALDKANHEWAVERQRADRLAQRHESTLGTAKYLTDLLQNLLEVDPSLQRFTTGVFGIFGSRFILWRTEEIAAAAAYRRGEAPEHKATYDAFLPGDSEADLVLTTRQKNALAQFFGICFTAAKERGFHDRGDVIRAQVAAGEPGAIESWRDYTGSKLALIHSEASEAVEQLRNGETFERPWFKWTLPDSLGNSDADKIVREHGIAFAVENETRAEHLSDGDILTLVVAGYLKPEGILSELADVVIRTGDLTGSEQADLVDMIDLKLAYNATRGRLHGGKF
jgi:hypothetical protein